MQSLAEGLRCIFNKCFYIRKGMNYIIQVTTFILYISHKWLILGCHGNTRIKMSI